MTDVASLSLEVRSDQVKQATAELRELPKAASAAERAAQKWGLTTSAAARSTEEFSKRVRKTIADLEFERQQLQRNSAEQVRFAALKRAGVSASSAEGQAITAGVRALQAQQAAYDLATARAELYRKVKFGVAAAIAVATAAVTAFVKNAFDAAAGMDELAEQVGVTARTFQALQFAAVQGGIKVEQLETGLTKFSQKMGEAADGSKEMIDALTRLGVKNLDVHGKLRPTEDLLTDVAKAITAIDDPARRTSAAVDLFGRAGAKLLPILAQIAQGTETMASAAETAGAMISGETSKKLDEFADRLDRAKLIARAWAAETLAATIDASRAFAEFDDRVTASVANAFGSIGKIVDEVLGPIGDKIGQVGASAAAMFVEAFASMPEALGRLFTNAWEAARVATAKGINTITGWLAQNAPWLGVTGTNMDTTAGGAGPAFAGIGDRIAAAGAAAAADIAARQQAARDAVARDALLTRQAGMEDDEARARLGKLGATGTGTTGAATSAVKASGGAAENAAKKYEKLVTQLETTAKAQDQMTAASQRGEVAFEGVKIHLEAQQKALEIYGKVLDDTDPKLRKIEELLTRIAQGKAAEAFNVATTELEKQNVVLQRQIELMNEAPEIQAREIALIKAKQEAEKAGTAVTQEMIDARQKAIEQNETLKTQQEELKRAQDLWTAPLKSALESIQQTAADAFEGMLESGKINFDSLKDVFTRTLRRMAAEFLALATVRPVMSVLVNAISPSMASQMGLGTGNTASGGSGLSMPSIGGGGLFGGGGSGLLGGLGDWLNTPLTGPYAGLSPSAMVGVPTLSPSILSPSTWGITPLQGLGAAAGVGAGIYQLLSGGGSTASTIGGIGSIVGGAVSLIPGVGQIAGPAIAILSSILPSLFGESKPTITNQGYGQISYGGRGFGTSGGAWGPNADMNSLTGPLRQIGNTMDAVFNALGGVKDAGKVWGVALESFSQQYGSGSSFASQTSYVVDPSGRKRQVGQGSNEGDIGLKGAAASALFNSIMGGAVEISETLSRALGNQGQRGLINSIEDIATVVQEVQALDEAMKSMGKTMLDAQQAINAVDDSFSPIFDVLDKYGLSRSQADAARLEQRLKAANDFGDSISQALLEIRDPTQAALEALDREKRALDENHAWMVNNVAGFQSRIAEIEELFALRRTKIVEDANAAMVASQRQAANDMVSAVTGSVGTIQDLIRDLSPGGALANLDPTSQLAGLKASYGASYAQAIADPSNSALINRAVSDARSYLEFDRTYTGGNSTFARDQQAALQQLQNLQAATAQQAGQSAGVSSDPELKNLFQQLLTAIQKPAANGNTAQRDADVTRLISLMLRYFADRKAA